MVQDWGTSYLIAQELGPQVFCLVDLGHHAPTVNIEMIVARLIQFGKLGGFHFNDSKYGDDDLDTGAIDPYRLFLVFNELVNAEGRPGAFNPAHMLDQSHNVTDPIESLIVSAAEVARAYAQASLVDRAALAACQEANDALMASQTLKAAFRTDVEPILAEARLRQGGALRPVAAYRASRYRARVAADALPPPEPAAASCDAPARAGSAKGEAAREPEGASGVTSTMGATAQSGSRPSRSTQMWTASALHPSPTRATPRKATKARILRLRSAPCILSENVQTRCRGTETRERHLRRPPGWGRGPATSDPSAQWRRRRHGGHRRGGDAN